MNELKPCPSCGGEVSLESKYLWYSGGWGKSYISYHVECEKCGKKGGYSNTVDHPNAKERTVREWNRRAGDTDGK